MKTNSNSGQPQTSNRHPLLLAGVAFALGIALTGFWFHSHSSASKNGGLSDVTKNLLGQLQLPVTIRYYSLLPAGSADESLQTFAGRVTQLLNTVQTAGDGKIQLVNIDTPSETNSTAASADGIQAFNLDKGDACFLGLAVASGGNKEAFARLDPQWESALEYDLARAILRVAAVPAPAKPAPEVAKPSLETIATVNRLIPDVNGVSVEQASQIFNAEFLKQCGVVGAEMEAQVKAAQQKVVDAQNNGSPTDLEAAQKHLMQAQLAQGQKYKELAANLQTQLAVFQRMKNGDTNAAK
jgi:hypothetical protein